MPGAEDPYKQVLYHAKLQTSIYLLNDLSFYVEYLATYDVVLCKVALNNRNYHILSI
jgi:hypothetical protein